MHGDIGPPLQHGRLHFFYEDAAAAHLVDRDVGAAVAGGLDHDDLDVAAEQLSDVIGLPPGQLAASGGGPQATAGGASHAATGRTAGGWPPPAARHAASPSSPSGERSGRAEAC